MASMLRDNLARIFGVSIFLAALALCASARAQSTLNYEGLWWAAPAGSESGWGINFVQQGDTIFGTWFTYSLNGSEWWLSMTATKSSGNPDTYVGQIIETRGPAFSAVPFDPTKVTRTVVGTATLTFSGATTGNFNYTVNGIQQTKSIVLQVFGKVPVCSFGARPDFAQATNYQDLWWVADGSESGWGINLIHQGSTIFATWFTYNTDGTPLWLSATLQQGAGPVFTGALIQTAGPPFNAVPFNPANVSRNTVGSATLTFIDGNTARFDYVVNAVAQSKSITRQLFSPPAGTLCQQTAATDYNLNGVAWVGTQFVGAAGKPGGSGIVYTSPTGLAWATRPATNPLRGVAASGGLIVIVGVQGAILTSADGVAWTSQTSGVGADLNWVAGSGSRFVAVGTGGTILTSNDSGVTWRPRPSGTNNELFGVAYSGALIVVVGDGGTLLTSPDGSAWTLRPSGVASDLLDVKWTGSQFIAVGSEGTILASPDGIAWTQRNSGVLAGLHGVAWSGSQYVIAEGNGNVLTSSDGIAWVQRGTGNATSLNDVAWSGSLFVVVGDAGTILTSPDGIAWTAR